MPESLIPTMDMSQLLKSPEVASQAPATIIETKLATVTPEDAAASTVEESSFQFRELLTQDQRTALKARAPETSLEMVNDYNKIINFGAPVLERLNSATVNLLNEQKDIKVPEADHIVNNMLREMDGFNAKYRNAQLEDAVSKIKNFFRGTTYSLKSMVRDSKPINDRFNEAEITIRKMEISLGDNVIRAKKLHEQTLMTMQEVISVLAVLEEIIEFLTNETNETGQLLKDAEAKGQLASVEYRGKLYSLQDFSELHQNLSDGLKQVELSWFDWRQQFFLGYASAPSLRNLILVSASMQRRLLVFRTQGIPSARRALAQWQQAALAEEGAKLGNTLNSGTNKFIQDAADATARSVDTVARAAEAPMITEETIFKIIESVQSQAASLVAADKWGREVRNRSITAIENGERSIAQTTIESRKQLVANAVSANSTQALESGPGVPSTDILGQLGVKK